MNLKEEIARLEERKKAIIEILCSSKKFELLMKAQGQMEEVESFLSHLRSIANKSL